MSDNEYLEIGATPPEESCMQAGDDYDPEQAMEECDRYIKLLRQVFGPEPDGARLTIHSNSHEFGIYHEVVCRYDRSKPDSLAYAFACEGNGPIRWSDTKPRAWRENGKATV